MRMFFLVKTALLVFILTIAGCGGSTDVITVDYREDDGTGISATSPEAGQVLSNVNGWEQKAVFYHVWVRAFCDGEYGDGIGDLKGVIDRIDYLYDLGVTAIWLSPIFECSYKGDNMHGYDTMDYYRINDRFGTSEDVKNLLIAAHAKGMKVIFDFVPNHTSNAHPWVASNPEYYLTASSNQGWPAPWGGSATTWFYNAGKWFYSAFTVDSLYDLNYMYTTDNGSTYPVRTQLQAVAKYWLDCGFDGLRMDAVRYIVENGSGQQADQTETHTVLKEFRTLINSYTLSHKMMVGEAWTGTEIIKTYYGNGTDEFNMCFDFGLPYNIRDAIGAGSASPDVSKYSGYADYVKGLGFPNKLAAFSVNHDNVVSRAATNFSSDRKKCIDSAALNILSYGVPFIYYGEEVGMTGASGNDIDLRATFPWDSVTAQDTDPQSILSWYKHLIAARTGNLALNEGGFTVYSNTGSNVISYVKDWGDQYVLVVVNLAGTAQSFDVTGLPVSSGTPSNIIGANSASSFSGSSIAIDSIPARGVRVILLQNGSGTAYTDSAGNAVGYYTSGTVFANDLQ